VSERQRERRERGITPAGLPAEPSGPVRPPRPVAVELASAMMVVSGLISVLTSIESTASLAARDQASLPLAALSLVLGIGFVILGVLVRRGSAWLVAVNVAAVAGFLELSSGSAQGILFGALDVLVVLILMRQRPWFHGSPDAKQETTPPD
jgi:hypothetical protein